MANTGWIKGGFMIKCVGTNCQVRKTCYRYIWPDDRQSLYAFYDDGSFRCESGCGYRLHVTAETGRILVDLFGARE